MVIAAPGGAGRRFGGKGTWTGLRASAGRRRYRLSSDLPKHPPPDRRRPSPPHLASSSYLLPSPPLQPLLASPSPPSPVRPPMENGSRPPKHGGAGKLTSNTKGRNAPLPKEPDADDVVSRLPPLLFLGCWAVYLGRSRSRDPSWGQPGARCRWRKEGSLKGSDPAPGRTPPLACPSWAMPPSPPPVRCPSCASESWS